MSNVIPSLNKDPRFKFFQDRYNHTVELAAEKAALHLKNPQQYPLPPGNQKSLERGFYDFIHALSKKKQEKFLEKMQPALSLSATQRQQKYGDLASINLKINTPVAEQVKTLPVADSMKFSPEDIKNFRGGLSVAKKIITSKIGGKLVPRQAAVATKLDFIVDSVTCVKTNDIRKDEVNLGAFATDSAGVNSDKAPFFVNKFKDGESKGLGANATLFSFSLDGGSVGGEFPLTFIAGVFLVEKDIMANTELGLKLSGLFSLLGLTLMIVGVGLMLIPGMPITIILVTFLVSLGFSILGHYVFPAIIDDISEPAIDTLVLDALPAIGDTFNRTLEFDLPFLGFNDVARGSYKAAARWVVS